MREAGAILKAFPWLLDRREFLHLDWPPRRPACLGAAGGGAASARGSWRRRRSRRPGCGARGSADRGRQRLVLVVRDDHSSDLDAEFDDLFRRHLRMPTLFWPAHSGRPCHQQHFDGRAGRRGATAGGWIAPVIDGRTAATSSGSGGVVRRPANGRRDAPARRSPPVVTSVRFGFSGSDL